MWGRLQGCRVDHKRRQNSKSRLGEAAHFAVEAWVILTMATLTMAIRPMAILTMALLPMARLAVKAWVDIVHPGVGPHLSRSGVGTEVRGRGRGRGRGEGR